MDSDRISIPASDFRRTLAIQADCVVAVEAGHAERIQGPTSDILGDEARGEEQSERHMRQVRMCFACELGDLFTELIASGCGQRRALGDEKIELV